MKINKVYAGKWRITEMEQWDKDYIDMVAPGHITIGNDGMGSLLFGAVEAESTAASSQWVGLSDSISPLREKTRETPSAAGPGRRSRGEP